MQDSREMVQQALTLAATTAAAMAVRKALEGAWRKSAGGDPPSSDLFGDESVVKALAWMAVMGVGVAVARSLAEEGTRRMIPTQQSGPRDLA